MSEEKVIFLIDMNAYFASIEQLTNPNLKGKPVVICGQGRTVVTTASYEARNYGIKTGMTLPEARRLCPGVIPVCGNMDKYVDTSLNVHKVFLNFTDFVEVFSIDECFLDVTSIVKRGRSPKDIANDIKRSLKDKMGLMCSVGIGPNKFLAKLASKMQKPDGLVEIKKEDIPSLFSKLRVEDMQGVGIGKKTSVKLKNLGINTARDMGEANLSMLTSHFGVLGYQLKNMGVGKSDSDVLTYWQTEPIKSMGHSYTLPKDTYDISIIKSYLRMLCEKVGFRLRNKNCTGKTVCLTLRYSDFDTITKRRTLKHCIRSGNDLYFNTLEIFKSVIPLKKKIRLLGVSISALTSYEKQIYMFDIFKRDEKLTKTMDSINHKYGDFTIKPLSLILADRFGMQRKCGMFGKRYLAKKNNYTKI